MYPLKQIFIIISLILYTKCVLGQKPVSDDPKNNFWYNWNEPMRKKLHLAPLVVTQTWFHWRLWYNGQEISYIIDMQGENGSITIYTEEYDTLKPDSSRLLYYEVHTIGFNGSKIHDLIIATGISNIPTDSLIAGWGQGNDGITFNIEHREGPKYSFKSYWTPTAIKVPEAKIIQSFVDSAGNILDLKVLLKTFTKHIPFRSYNTGGPATSIKPLTAEELLLYKSELKRLNAGSNKQLKTEYGYLAK
jgi:hypothetical protein